MGPVRRRRHVTTRPTRTRLAVALGLVVALTAALVAAPVGSAAGATDLRLRGSLEQLAVLGATPRATLELIDDGGAVVRAGVADDAGSLLWRDVAPGDYSVRHVDAGTTTDSGPVTVRPKDWLPDPDWYAAPERLTDPTGAPLPITANPVGVGDGDFGYLETRDGTRLSVSVYLPGPPKDARGEWIRYPTVIEYSGYAVSRPGVGVRLTGNVGIDNEASTAIMRLLGYAVVAVNIRGTGCSDGAFDYFEHLQATDGYDAVEVIARQPWVRHGHVGMVGISYPGISQLFVAQTQPPHLAAVAPLSVIGDTYRSVLYPGGIFNNGFALDWATDRVNQARPYGQGWERGRVAAGDARCAEHQQLRGQNRDLLGEIEANPYYDDELGDPLSPSRFVDRIQVPMFLAGAWHDEQTGGEFANMLQRADADVEHKFTLTNGTHVDSLLTNLTRWTEFLDFYVKREIPAVPLSVRPFAGVIGTALTGSPLPIEDDRFRVTNGGAPTYPSYAAALAAYEAEPRVRVLFENGGVATAGYGVPTPTGTFARGFGSWPPPSARPTDLFLQPDGGLASAPPAVPAGEARGATAYRYDPASKQTLVNGSVRPLRSYYGSGSAIWTADPAYDWRPLPLGAAVAFETAPIEATTVLAGPASLDLWLRSRAADTDLEVTLTEVRPDGQERYVQSGWLRASHRALDAESTALLPRHTHLEEDAAPLPANGTFTKVRVPIFPFAHVLRPGSRLRLSIEAPNGNRPFWTFDALPAPGGVLNEVAHSRAYPSKLVLPVVTDPTTDVPAALPPCPSLRGQPCRTYAGTGAPTAVTGGSDEAGVVQVSWLPPAPVAGDALVGTTVFAIRQGGPSASGDVAGVPVDVAPGTSTATLTGLPAGRYAVGVTARYASGATVPSTPSPAFSVRSGPPADTASVLVVVGDPAAPEVVLDVGGPLVRGDLDVARGRSGRVVTVTGSGAIAVAGGELELDVDLRRTIAGLEQGTVTITTPDGIEATTTVERGPSGRGAAVGGTSVGTTSDGDPITLRWRFVDASP